MTAPRVALSMLAAAVVGAVGGLAAFCAAIDRDDRADRQQYDEDPWFGARDTGR